MNYADIKRCDVANGPGVRVSLFVSGCTHHCKECFNPETWDFAYGDPFTEETIEQILDYLKPDYIKGLTLLGGEPLEQENQKGLLPLLRQVHEKFPEKTVWCFTGYDFVRDV
ncbi:MAG: anaerobic ribonucleoside-triphosphate reductase activating protein, partial [Lachnospiraceae bacterium]|nr:anaerobic ribonucleoside-triphosphate reductase activating protein [Lachnospiraceae bacterium]